MGGYVLWAPPAFLCLIIPLQAFGFVAFYPSTARSRSVHVLFIKEICQTSLQKYGPIVRVGPKAVILSDIEDLREVYRGHKYRKSSWYDFFVFDNVPNIFATT